MHTNSHALSKMTKKQKRFALRAPGVANKNSSSIGAAGSERGRKCSARSLAVSDAWTPGAAGGFWAPRGARSQPHTAGCAPKVSEPRLSWRRPWTAAQLGPTRQEAGQLSPSQRAPAARLATSPQGSACGASALKCCKPQLNVAPTRHRNDKRHDRARTARAHPSQSDGRVADLAQQESPAASMKLCIRSFVGSRWASVSAASLRARDRRAFARAQNNGVPPADPTPAVP